MSKQELRAAKTKKAILVAAEKLFSIHGFDAVTMRQIAKEAGCSHTTIYIYFTDKIALLHELSMPPLSKLKEYFQNMIDDSSLSARGRLKKMSREFIRYCFNHRNMYSVLFIAQAGRVDDPMPELEINRLRNELFAQFKTALGDFLNIDAEDRRLLDYSRVYFYMLHGIIGTYLQSKESVEALADRLQPTFELAIDVVMNGLRQQAGHY